MCQHKHKDAHEKESTPTLHDPFDPNASLEHGCSHAHPGSEATELKPMTTEDAMDRLVETAVVKAVFGGNDFSRRNFMKIVGSSAAFSILSSLFPLDAAKAWAKESDGPPEKKDLQIGFIPITCGTPIIMAEPMKFYEKNGLTGTKVVKAAGWAMIRDWAVSKQVDCAHMLSPMPLALTLGAGAPPVPFYMPAVENVNGQAITLHIKHKDVKEPKDMRGFTFCVPFDYSMHNMLLRYYLADGGVDPDKEVKIRVVPPPEMVANLKAQNVDGYLAPDPFNQRAVFEGAGFIFKLTKDLWPGHPCCAFATSKEFATQMPNTFKAVFKSIVEATMYAHKAENRKEIAKAISPRNFLNQPEEVVEQVLTGQFPDGLGNTRNEPDRIDFNPFPWNSMAVWILTQMKRWGYIKGDVDYKKIAEQVFLAAECADVMKGLGYAAPSTTYMKHVIMGKEFDPEKPEEYLNSFAIKKL
ncbi:MAG: ABC transporter substrate-binding protein [Desulfomonile tiedjei]|nr:ABC transporter substrate-binding protein [Desulfomonile tiedjei]